MAATITVAASYTTSQGTTHLNVDRYGECADAAAASGDGTLVAPR